jgi:hypothetical protein
LSPSQTDQSRFAKLYSDSGSDEEAEEHAAKFGHQKTKMVAATQEATTQWPLARNFWAPVSKQATSILGSLNPFNAGPSPADSQSTTSQNEISQQSNNVAPPTDAEIERLLKPPPEVALAMELNARRRKQQQGSPVQASVAVGGGAHNNRFALNLDLDSVNNSPLTTRYVNTFLPQGSSMNTDDGMSME